LKLRATIIAVLAALSSLALLVPHAHASGQACYSVHVAANGSDVVNEAGCVDIP
jgi:hypothetical protein